MTRDDITRRGVLKGVAAGAAATGVAAGGGASRTIVGLAASAGFGVATRRADEVHRRLDFGDVGKAVAGRFPARALEALVRNPNVRYVENDAAVYALGETLPWGVDRVDADVARGNGYAGDGADVAVVDTGIDDDHPDLRANLGTGTAFVDCGSADDCRYGEPNDNDCNVAWSDDHDHGTHCAGIADAVNDDEGVVGVATGATLHAVKVLGGCGAGALSNVAAGLEYVADRGWDVASMSFGAGSGSRTLADAVRYADDNGVLLVAAAGNGGPCTDCVAHPAAYPEVVAVGSTDEDDSLSGYSSTGPEVELAAPGRGVLSTVPPESSSDGLAYYSGTSMSCPHVAAVGGLLMAEGLSNAEARSTLQGTAEDLGLSSDEQGHGLVDAEAATDALGPGDDASVAVSTGTPSDVTDSSATLSGSLEDLGGAASADCYFEYREVGASTWSATAVRTQSSTGSFSDSVGGLSPGTDYEFRAVADASDGDTDAGSAVAFATDSGGDTSVAVSTGAASDVTDTSATLSGSLEDLGGASSADCYFEYREVGASTWSATAGQTLSATGSFDDSVGGLSSGTDYEFRAVADASDGDTDAGSAVAFTTDSSAGDTAPAVDAYSVTEKGSPNPHAQITADWSVSDADGDLDGVLVEVYDAGGSLAAASTTNVGGSSASGSDSFKLLHRGGETYDVTLTVTDAGGNAASRTGSVSS